MNHIIDQRLIDSAASIRNEYQSLNSKIMEYEPEVKSLTDFLFKITTEIESYKKNELMKVSNIKEASDYLVGRMTSMEDESNRVNKLIDPINLAIEKLKDDEMELYLEIKRKYPNLSDDAINTEISIRINT